MGKMLPFAPTGSSAEMTARSILRRLKEIHRKGLRREEDAACGMRCSCGRLTTPGDAGYHCEICGAWWPFPEETPSEEENKS